MFIDKINSVLPNIGFKGYQHLKNDVGETIIKFNYPYDYENEICEVEIFKVQRTDNYNYKVNESPIKTITLDKDGKTVNLQKETNLDKDEAFAYKIIRKDKKNNNIWQGADTGVKIRPENGEYVFRIHLDNRWQEAEYHPINDDGTTNKNETRKYWYETAELGGPNEYKYTLVKQNGTKPLVQGAGYLAMPDTYMPGMKYRNFYEENTGDIYYDENYQKTMENMVKTPSNMYGGNLAGLEVLVPELKKNGFKILFTTPIANGDNRTSHGYWNKNNFQIAPNFGTAENYDSLMQKEFQHGIKHVFDATLTSEGIEGINVKYALKWGEQAQSHRWFRLNGLKDESIAFGILPDNMQNVRHRIINGIYKYEKQSDGTNKEIVNNNYNPNAATLIQFYDATQVTEEQLNKLDNIIEQYNDIKAGKNLNINTTDDTIISYVFEINPNEYINNIRKINDLIKNENKKIDINSPEGTVMATNFSNFRFAKGSSGYVAWDDNPDMVKVNYGLSGYDEKELQAISDKAQRQYEQDMRVRASKETTDMAVQTGIYWADKTKTAHEIYVAQVLGNAKSANSINKLIEDGKLPEEVRVSQNIIDNILNGEYNLKPKVVLSKDDATVKALMKLPLVALEFGDDTLGVLSTSYFSNRAIRDEQIGVSRFDLMKLNNPHLVDTYANIYNKVNNMYTNELKEFALSIIQKVNETSDEPLLDASGNYTEYGEYVIERFGANIAKYALLKSLAGNNLKYKILHNGTLTYNYNEIKKYTELKQLGINANSAKEEAELLQKKIFKGIKVLSENDITEVAKAISTSIKGSDTNTFRITEALVDRAGLEPDFRLDAAKDVMDIDAIRNRDDAFDEVWTNLIKFWEQFVNGVKTINPHANFVAEMTNIPDILRDTYGPESCPYNGATNVNNAKFNGEPDAMTKFFNETGITTEAAYSYFFTELLTAFSRDFETGTNFKETHDDFLKKYKLLINTRSADYLRNLYTFMGNHDKARTVHGLAVDMELFHSTLIYRGADFNKNHNQRLDVIKVMSGTNNINNVPLELRLNVDNLDYFRTISASAVAQTKLLMNSVDEDLKGIATPEDIKILKEALIDLTNGNYLTSKNSEKMTKIKINELSSIENAVKEIARLTKLNGVILSDSEIQNLVANINKLNFDEYAVRGDFNWGKPNEKIGEQNRKYLKEIIGTDKNSMNYSLYTVQIARMIKNAANGTAKQNAINSALKTFVETYNRDKINENMDSYKMFEDPIISRKKLGYASRDFRIAMEEVLDQAEYKTGKKFKNREDIIATVFNSVTEPALKKHAMILEFLSAFCGIPTLYAGDEYTNTGFEYKTKNITVQNRMAFLQSIISDSNSKLGKIMRRNRDITYNALKSKINLKPLQNGTPYEMDIMVNGKTRDDILRRIKEIDEICQVLTKDSKIEQELKKEQNMLKLELAKVAFMMQSADGDMVISVFNAAGINHNNRHNYFNEYNLHTENDINNFIKDNNIETINRDNPYIPIQKKTELDAILLGAGITIPIGTKFINTNGKDKLEYIVDIIDKVGNKIGIKRVDGKKIVLDGLTSRNGVMNLRKAFRGRQHTPKQYFNKKYYLNAENQYQISINKKQNEFGKKLSIISK